jgi:endogenous inhibitor of DNA gyrase (YacG/DUF329 family)
MGRRKKQRPYRVRLLVQGGEGKPGKVVASRDFMALDETGAKRGAAHWYKELCRAQYPDDLVAGAHTAWETQYATSETPEFHYCQTNHGLLAVHATDSKDIAQATVEEEVAEADKAAIMGELIANPQAVKKQYRGRSEVLLAIMENYFAVNNPFWDDLRRDPKVLLAADIVYDWTGAPQMLARAWGVEPKRIRRMLDKDAIVECPFCGKQIEYSADRVFGGFEFTLENTPCPACQTPLIEINPNVISFVPDEWRTAQSPYWIAPNPEQEREWAMKRLTLVRDDPRRYFAVGRVVEGRRQSLQGYSHYTAFVEQAILQIQPQARIARYSAPETKGGAEDRLRAFFKAWADSLGGEHLGYTKYREKFVFDTVARDADWLIIDRAEHLGDYVLPRLRDLDHWRQVRMILIWHGYYCSCLGGLRRIDRDSDYQRESEAKFPPLQMVLWLPDPEQI